MPALARIFMIWLPIHLAKYRHGRWFTLDEIRTIGYLETWRTHILPLVAAEDVVVVLDPGSVYWLSALREFGPPFTKDRVFLRWWEEKLNQWCSALDTIVWLEAPREVLLQRVVCRDEWHAAKFLSSAAALEEFARLSLSYERVIAELGRRKKIRVFHYHTDQVSVEKMVAEIQSTVDLGRSILSLSYSIGQKLRGYPS